MSKEENKESIEKVASKKKHKIKKIKNILNGIAYVQSPENKCINCRY